MQRTKAAQAGRQVSPEEAPLWGGVTIGPPLQLCEAPLMITDQQIEEISTRCLCCICVVVTIGGVMILAKVI